MYRCQWLSRCQQKIIFVAYYFFEVTFLSVFRDKKFVKKSQNSTVDIKVFLTSVACEDPDPDLYKSLLWILDVYLGSEFFHP
jgi:hypothetical protein